MVNVTWKNVYEVLAELMLQEPEISPAWIASYRLRPQTYVKG